MEQKDYKLEIIQELLRGESHTREIARVLLTNHMNISRTLKKLIKGNVVDYKQIGKNKSYFIKNTSEARVYVLMSEYYKKIRFINKYGVLRSIIEKIEENGDVGLAIIFGSYAKGLAKKDSDIDIYIETQSKELKKILEELDSRLSVKIGNFDLNNLLIKEIMKNHVIIKGAEEYYDKVKFFG